MIQHTANKLKVKLKVERGLISSVCVCVHIVYYTGIRADV